jgi:mono/diheme cytochrome c family protein
MRSLDLALLVAALALTACRRPPAPAAPPVDPMAVARDEARFVLEQQCGTCHRSDQPTANPRALAVFDLDEPDFARGLTDAQLASAMSRLAGPRNTFDGQPIAPADRERVRAYFELVKGRRDAPPDAACLAAR